MKTQRLVEQLNGGEYTKERRATLIAIVETLRDTFRLLAPQ